MDKLSKGLVNRVLGKLGFSSPPSRDVAGLQSLYQSWCFNVPFDNIRKMIALRADGIVPLPGMDASEFLENWLENGSGATCWPMANTLYEFLKALDFNAYRVKAAMRDVGVINHGTVKVNINGSEFLADASLLLNVIIPLDHNIFLHDDLVYPVESEQDGDSHLIWSLTPPSVEYFSCRINKDPVDVMLFSERYETSREQSIFNHRLYARKNFPGKLIIILGHTLYSKTAFGVERRDLTRDQLCDALKNMIGLSENLLTEWVKSGSLDASFEPPSKSPPPPSAKKPPSMR